VFDSGNKIGGEPAITVLPAGQPPTAPPRRSPALLRTRYPDLQDSL